MDDVREVGLRTVATVLLWCVVAGAAGQAPPAAGPAPGCPAGQNTTASKCKKDKDVEHVDDIVYLNAKEERTTCVVPIKATEDSPKKTPECKDIEHDKNFLMQGHRAQLRVVNRRFFSDYSFNIDGVTQLKQIAIQDLEEAANLSAPISSTVSAAPKGVAPKGLSTAGQLNLRTAHDLLAELLDEGTAANPATELESDGLVLEREARKVTADVAAVEETWKVISGGGSAVRDCRASLGAPTTTSALSCLSELYVDETTKDWSLSERSFADEDKFRSLLVRVNDAVTLVKALGTSLQQNSSAMLTQASTLDGDLAAWTADLNTLRGSLYAADDAIKSFNDLTSVGAGDGALTSLRRAEIKLRLSQDINGAAAGGKTTIDDAELNRLVDAYASFSKNYGRSISLARQYNLQKTIDELKKNQACGDPKIATEVLAAQQTHLGVEVPKSVDDINAKQSQVLARANEIYDLSAVPEPLDKWIDLSKNSGNLLVYYTVRRVDVFPRYTVPVVTLQGATAPVPPLAPPATATTLAPAAGADTSTGTVVAHGSLEVHDFYRATVVAGFTFSTIKDQSVKSRPVTSGTATDGTACSTATPCSQPFLDKGSPIPAVVVGVNYYLSKHGHDTFPGAKRGIGQKVGIFGGLAANRVNSYFLGLGYEPSEAIQLTGGVNFALQDSISGTYSASQVYAGTPSFGGRNVWSKGAYLGVGFNLSIFRKIFGSVTGLGTKATGGGS
jgi:hypothetical protein